LLLCGCDVQSQEETTSYLARTLADQMERGTRMAIIGFYEETGGVSELDVALYEDLFHDLKLASGDRMGIVAHRSIEEAMQELNLQQQDLFDDKMAARVGRFVGANVNVKGVVEKRFGFIYKINLKAYSVETLMAAGVARTVLTDIWSPWFAATIVALLGAAGLVALIVFKNAKKRQRRRDLEDS